MIYININNFIKKIYILLEQTIKYNEPINISTFQVYFSTKYCFFCYSVIK